MIEDENNIEELQKLPEDEILLPEEIEIEEKIEEEPVCKCRKGFGKFIVTNSEHFIIFIYEFKVKDPNLENVRTYLQGKYIGCDIKEVR